MWALSRTCITVDQLHDRRAYACLWLGKMHMITKEICKKYEVHCWGVGGKFRRQMINQFGVQKTEGSWLTLVRFLNYLIYIWYKYWFYWRPNPICM